MGDDYLYYYRRAERELDMAQKATSPAAVKAHYTLARFYLDRVHGGGREPLAARMDGSLDGHRS